MNYYKSIYNNKIKYLRNLNNNYNLDYTIVDDYKENIIINKLSTTNGDNEALYIHLSEFYSITKREKINNLNLMVKKKKIKI